MICHNEDCAREAVSGKGHCEEHACAYPGCSKPRDVTEYCQYHDGYMKRFEEHKARIAAAQSAARKQKREPKLATPRRQREPQRQLVPQPPQLPCAVRGCDQPRAEDDLCKGCGSLFLVWVKYARLGAPSPITPNAGQLAVFNQLFENERRLTGT